MNALCNRRPRLKRGEDSVTREVIVLFPRSPLQDVGVSCFMRGGTVPIALELKSIGTRQIPDGSGLVKSRRRQEVSAAMEMCVIRAELAERKYNLYHRPSSPTPG